MPNFTETVQRELEHAARWVSHFKGKDTQAADKWQARWDKIYDDATSVVALASDGEVVTGDQSDWVKAQALPIGPSIAVNRTGSGERVIRRIGDDPDDDGRELCPA
jgi:hypothetical protein